MIFDYVKKLFGFKPEKSKKSRNPSSYKNYKTKILKTCDPRINTLERLILQSDFISMGRVHLLGLTELKHRLGKKWPVLRGCILTSLDKIISTRINKTDVYFSRSDEEHIIVFSKLSDNKARLICAKILQDLTAIYLGSEDTCDIIVKSAIGKAQGNLLFKSMSLDEIINEVSFTEVPSTKHKYNYQKEYDRKWLFSEKETPYEVVFKPIWDVRNEIISTYMVNSRSIDLNEKIYLGYDVLTNPKCIEDMTKLDHAVMNESIIIIDKLFSDNIKAIFSIPVSYESVFNSDMLKDFLSHCQFIPPVLHKYISFTLLDFPYGVPEVKLRFIVSSLTNYSRAVVMTCGEIPQNISFYVSCGVKGICLAMPKKRYTPKEYWDQLAVFVHNCKQLNIASSLENVDQVEDFILAREIGVNFLSGDVVGPYSDTPKHMLHVSWKELIA